MNFCYLLRINLNRVFVIVSLLIYPSVASSDNIGNFANKLFNHYEYDDKINNYLKSIFSFGNSKKNKSKSKFANAAKLKPITKSFFLIFAIESFKEYPDPIM